MKPEEIKSLRLEAGLTQQQAAELIYCSVGAWKKWESGDREMHRAFFELFKIKSECKGHETLERGIDGIVQCSHGFD